MGRRGGPKPRQPRDANSTKARTPLIEGFSLSDKQKLVCHYYLADPKRSPEKAYMRVFQEQGEAKISSTNARKNAQVLFRNPGFAAYLSQQIDRLNKKIHLEEENILQEWAKIGLLDPGDAYDHDGKLLNIKDMPIHVRKAISSIEVDEHSGTTKVKFHSKASALDSLGKHFGMFKKIKELRLTWMDSASPLQKLERRHYIEEEMIKRGMLPAPIEEKDITEESEVIPDDATIQ